MARDSSSPACEVSTPTGSPAARRWAAWSSMRAMSGLMTSVSPGRQSAGAW